VPSTAGHALHWIAGYIATRVTDSVGYAFGEKTGGTFRNILYPVCDVDTRAKMATGSTNEVRVRLKRLHDRKGSADFEFPKNTVNH
jgi:hypothetical protein